MEKLKIVISNLSTQEKLEPRYKYHQLIGNYKERRECHIELEWLLIYKKLSHDNIIIFERTGTHSDLFR